MKAIAYSLFGYGRKLDKEWCDHDSYVRGLMTNVRVNRVLFPSWVNVLNIDAQSYSAYRRLYDWLQNKGHIVINIQPDDEPLCMAMLWRLKTVFSYVHPHWIYSHVLCRDIDSISTYREAQAVQQWIDEEKTAHCITDSISHNIHMMGGMCGFKPDGTSSLLGVNSFKELIKLAAGIDFNKKNADQAFLGKYVYPKLASSVTEHFVLGMKHDLPEEDGRHYSIPDYKIEINPLFKCTNELAGHIGAAGWYTPKMVHFLNHVDPYREDYAEIERQFPKLFFWR